MNQKIKLPVNTQPQDELNKKIIDKYGFMPYEFLSEYQGAMKPIKIKCKKCGKIRIANRANYLRTYDVPCDCYREEERKPISIIEDRVIKASNGKKYYEFLDKDFLHTKDPLNVKCLKCGYEFQATLTNILRAIKVNKTSGYYCPNCNNMIRSGLSYEERLQKVNPDIINLEPFITLYDKIKHKCLKCGYEWTCSPINRLKGEGCPKCSKISIKSNIETELKEYIDSFYKEEIICNSRKIIAPKELDMYFPDKKVAIEFDGNYWHNSKKKPKDYHKEKNDKCEELGIHLIHFNNSDYITENQKRIVKAKIKHILGYDDNPSIYARKCYVEEISTSDKNQFLEENHIQGKDQSKIKLGLWYPTENGDRLVSVMTFCKPRKALGHSKDSEYDYELSRFANDIEFRVLGSFGKLFKYFKDNYEFHKIITYGNRKWTYKYNSIYLQNGFTMKDKPTKPNYWYFHRNNDDILYYRYTYRKSELKRLFPDIYDDNKTEVQIMEEANYLRIFDCGNFVYEYTQ